MCKLEFWGISQQLPLHNSLREMKMVCSQPCVCTRVCVYGGTMKVNFMYCVISYFFFFILVYLFQSFRQIFVPNLKSKQTSRPFYLNRSAIGVYSTDVTLFDWFVTNDHFKSPIWFGSSRKKETNYIYLLYLFP